MTAVYAALECSGGGEVETGGGATDLPHTAPHGTQR